MIARALVASVALATVARAQNAVLISHRDLGLFAIATAGTAALSLKDVRIARTFGDSTFHDRHAGITSFAKGTSLVTETTLMIAGGATWAIARQRNDQGAADVAFHTTEAVLWPAMFIQVIRGTLGRARPYVIDDAGEKRDGDPYEFQLFHGFTSFNYRSFPSMHAMASFAAATALTQEMRFRHTPNRQVISPILYVGASMSPLARAYLDEHWASDLALGAFLGIFSGQKVVQYSHAHPDNRLDHKFLQQVIHATITHDARGFSFQLLPF